MTDRFQQNLEAMERAAKSVSRENPHVREQVERVTRSIERLENIADKADSESGS